MARTLLLAATATAALLGTTQAFAPPCTMMAKPGGGRKGPAAAKGFGSRPGGDASPASPLRSTASARAPSRTSSAPPKSPQAAAQETESRIRAALDALAHTNPSLHRAVQLQQALNHWDSRTKHLGILEQAALPPKDVAMVASMREELADLMGRDGVSELTIAAAFQEATWDAVAGTRAVGHRRVEEDLPASAIAIMGKVSDAVVGGRQPDDVKVLDIGTGTGVLIRFLRKAGVKESNVVGIDLSAAMLSEARATYPKATFLRANFLSWDGSAEGAMEGSSEVALPQRYDTVCFNAVLHHLPDAQAALERAAELLAPGGRIVVSHPKGASSVGKQHRHNTLLVPSLMPSRAALHELAGALGMEVLEGSFVDTGDAYVATLARPAHTSS